MQKHIKNTSNLLILLIAALMIGCDQQAIPQQPIAKSLHQPVPYLQRISYENAEQADAILVKYKSNVPSGARARSLSAAGLTETGHFSLVPGLTKAQPVAGVSVTETLQALALDESVAYAEPDFIVSTNLTPNDQRFPDQFALNNRQNTLADISATEAWDITTGSENIVIAVIDSGVDYNHPDLAANIWVNIDEIPNNRIDDDQNGFVDDIRGWNFSANNNNPMDDNNHGTHVSGIIGAVGNNSQGISGVNWNVKIMPLKFMNARGQGRTSSAINALEYAVANGARISNNSWGGGAYSQAMFDAIQAANANEHLFITAAGNDGLNNDNTPSYPANYNLSNIISVAATDRNDNLAGFSNFGPRTVDLAAPGVAILSTVRNNQYRELSGTSMATPFVAGAAGLLLSRNLNLSVLEIRDLILANADQINSARETVSAGRLNIFASLSTMNLTPVAPAPVQPNPIIPNQLVITSGLQELTIGSVAQLLADGGVPPLNWSVDNSLFATIDPVTGSLKAVSAGQVNVIVSDSVGSSSVPLIVNIIPDSSSTQPITADVAIVPNVQDVAIGASKQMTATGGVPPYTWSVDLLNYARIDANTGVFTALTVGEVNVVVTDSTGATSSPYQVQITPMGILPNDVTQMGLNDTLTLSANGGIGPYTWEISNNNIASISPTGLDERECVITPLSTGVFTVTMSDTTFNSATTFEISIVEQPLMVTPAGSTLNIGESLQIEVSGGTSPFIFETTNPSVIEVDGGGLVTATGPGSALVRVIDFNNQFKEVPISVLAALSLDNSFLLLAPGESMMLNVSGGSGNYFWQSSNPAIANVSASGLVTGVSAGSTAIAVTDGNGISQSASVEVREVTISGPTVFTFGDASGALLVSGGVAPYTWVSSNPAIATIDADGLVTLVSPGSLTITVTDSDGFSATSDITVNAAPVTPTPNPTPVPAPAPITTGGHH